MAERSTTKGSNTERMARVESAVESVASSVQTLAKSVSMVAEKTDTLTSHVARLEAHQGRVPTGTILATGAFIISLMSVVGALTVGPLRSDVDALQKRRIEVEGGLLPDISSEISRLRSVDLQSKSDRERLMDQAFQRTRWEGRVDAMLEQHEMTLQRLESTHATREELSNVREQLQIAREQLRENTRTLHRP